MLVALVITGLAAGCGALPGRAESVTVMASWDPAGREGAAFLATLADFERDTGVEVRYQGVRTINPILRLADLAGTLPDIAVISSPAELARYARTGRLKPLSAADGFQDGQLLQDASGVVMKTDLKSMVWYGQSTAPAPQTWQDLLARSAGERDAGGVRPWCLGMRSGAESGWPGTDWIEDILLHRSGVGAYRRWATGELAWTSPEVRGAWDAWRELLTAAGTTDAAGIERMLLTGWDEAGKDLPAGCALEHQGSFARAVHSGHQAFFPFPRFDPAPPESGVEVSVDVAGLFSDKPAARRLLAYLAGRDGQQRWIGHAAGAFFSARTDIDRGAAYGQDPIGARIAEQLAASAESRCLDASDFMPQAVANAFATAILEFVADPTPARLDTVLQRLDATRRAVPTGEWLSNPCP